MVGISDERGAHLVGSRAEKAIFQGHSHPLKTLSTAPGRTTPAVNSRGFLLCFGPLIPNGLAHSSEPFPPGYVTLGNKASFQGPQETRSCYGSRKLEAWRGGLLFRDNHHSFSV